MSIKKTMERATLPGDIASRVFPGITAMQLRVTKVENGVIHCGPWEFDEATGAEIDEFLGWGPPPQMTGSYLNLIEPKESFPPDVKFDSDFVVLGE